MFWYMEEGSSPKIADQSLGSDGTSPFTNTSTTSEDGALKLWTPQAPAGDAGGESPLGAVDVKHHSPITRLMERSILQWSGQRCYGPPPDWEPLNLFLFFV